MKQIGERERDRERRKKRERDRVISTKKNERKGRSKATTERIKTIVNFHVLN